MAPADQASAHRDEWVRPGLSWAMVCVPLAMVVAFVGVLAVGGDLRAAFVVVGVGVVVPAALANQWIFAARRDGAPASQWALAVTVVVAVTGLCALVASSTYEIIRTAR